MKKKYVSALLAAMMVVPVAGCQKQAAAPAPATEATQEAAAPETEKAEDTEAAEEPAEPQSEIYASQYGWIVTYDPSVIRVEDNSDPADEVSFIYTGESAGTNMLTISMADGMLPNEFMDELQDTGSEFTVTGGFFPGTTDKWGYWVDTVDSDEGSGLHEEWILGEYSLGTLAFQFTTHKSGDDEIDIPCSDALAMIVDSVEYENFGPQTMYDGIPGTYIQTVTEEIGGEEVTSDYSITLNEDHTGNMSIQDVIPILWDDKMLIYEDGGYSYNYTKNGNSITVDMDGMDSTFTAEGAAEASLPAYEYPGPEAFYYAIYQYVTDELSKNYDPADVTIPSVAEVYIDSSDKDDIKYYADFWIFNYDLDGDTLETKSGGNYPGIIHLKETDGLYEVTKIELVEDGEDFDENAKKLFGDQYDAFMKVYSDSDLNNEIRAQIIANYVAANGLPITQYQDYGWEPVQLPQENIDTFYSDL